LSEVLRGEKIVTSIDLTHLAAFATGAVVFLITVLLVAKEKISFAVTLIFLVFALVAAIIVDNHEAFQKYFTRSTPISVEKPEKLTE
jgi:hypothetical protein